MASPIATPTDGEVPSTEGLKQRDEVILRIQSDLAEVRKLTDKFKEPCLSSQVAAVFAELLDSLIVDVACESHRASKLRLDHSLDGGELRDKLVTLAPASIMASNGLATPVNIENAKYTVDVFGRSHPAVALENFFCMNCGRLVTAGRYAPHLEKCMGKGRNASRVASRNISAAHTRQKRNSPIPSPLNGTAAPGNGSGSVPAAASNRTPNLTPTRTPNLTPTLTPEDSLRSGPDAASSGESHDDETKDLSYRIPKRPLEKRKRGALFGRRTKRSVPPTWNSGIPGILAPPDPPDQADAGAPLDASLHALLQSNGSLTVSPDKDALLSVKMAVTPLSQVPGSAVSADANLQPVPDVQFPSKKLPQAVRSRAVKQPRDGVRRMSRHRGNLLAEAKVADNVNSEAVSAQVASTNGPESTVRTESGKTLRSKRVIPDAR